MRHAALLFPIVPLLPFHRQFPVASVTSSAEHSPFQSRLKLAASIPPLVTGRPGFALMHVSHACMHICRVDPRLRSLPCPSPCGTFFFLARYIKPAVILLMRRRWRSGWTLCIIFVGGIQVQTGFVCVCVCRHFLFRSRDERTRQMRVWEEPEPRFYFILFFSWLMALITIIATICHMAVEPCVRHSRSFVSARCSKIEPGCWWEVPLLDDGHISVIFTRLEGWASTRVFAVRGCRGVCAHAHDGSGLAEGQVEGIIIRTLKYFLSPFLRCKTPT